MTELEKAVARALRLSDAAATKLLEEMQRNIVTAGAELIRSGVPADIVYSSNPLVDEAVVTYCLMKMDDQDNYERWFNAFSYQQDNLRKTYHE